MLLIIRAAYLFCQILIMIIVAQAIMSWFVRPGDMIYPFYVSLNRFTEPLYRPFRKLTMRTGGGQMIDFSPMGALLAIWILQAVLSRMMRGFM